MLMLATTLALVGLWTPAPAYAQTNAWQASYWANTMLAGEPVLVRNETEINHDWGTGSPHPKEIST
jgi:hypothetical protein